MINRYTLSEAQIRTAIEQNEFGIEITSSAPKVAVIMTQDWCPQWPQMDAYLKKLDKESFNFNIYETIYNKEKYYHDFMHFKEDVFRNNLVPYIRYYIDGIFTGESNYLPKRQFLEILGYKESKKSFFDFPRLGKN